MLDAGTISEPLALGPLFLAPKFVMFGNFFKSKPLIRSKLAAKKGMDVSLFERLYKMHEEGTTQSYLLTHESAEGRQSQINQLLGASGEKVKENKVAQKEIDQLFKYLQ